MAKAKVKKLVIALIAILLLIAGVKIFFEPFRVLSESMAPTLLVGDQIIISRWGYGWDAWRPSFGSSSSPPAFYKFWQWRQPFRGEVIVFRFPPKPEEDYLKRVIGLPGDTVAIRENNLYVNGKVQPVTSQGPYSGPGRLRGCPGPTLLQEQLDTADGTMLHDMFICGSTGRQSDFGPVAVPAGSVFVMGDNRNLTTDSRVWGPVPEEYIKGKALFIHLPLDPDNHYLPRWQRLFKWIH